MPVACARAPMRSGKATALLLFSALLHVVVTQEIGEIEEGDVLTLTKDNWETSLKQHERILVEFFTPGDNCFNCSAFEIEYGKVAQMMKAEQLDTILAKIDASVETELGERFKVASYPSLKYFVSGKFSQDFDGAKDFDSMVRWLKNKEDPPVKMMRDEDIESFLDKVETDEYALVAHIKKKSVRAKAFFKCVEDTLREWDKATIKFAAVWLPKDADPKADVKLFMHRPGIMPPDPERVDYMGVWSEERIAWWAQNATYATLGRKFSRNSYAPMSIDEMGWTAAVVGVVDDGTEIEGTDKREEPLRPQLEEVLLPLALQYPEWKFVTAEIEKLEDHEFDLLGTSLGEEPRIVVMMNRKKYHLIGEDAILDHMQIREFFDNIKAKKQKPFYKSAVAPEEVYDEDGSLILTGDTFEEVVLDKSKDVFVMFYSPSCPHCQELAPEWEALVKKANKLGWKDRGIEIAKMDATENECEEEIPSFPRLVLYPAVEAKKKFSKKLVYSGERKAGSLLDFLTETARNLQEDGEDEEEQEPTKKKRKNKRRKDKSSGDSVPLDELTKAFRATEEL